MSMKTVKRIAAYLFKSGVNKVRVKPGHESRVAETLTREDVRALVKEGIVHKAESRGISRARGKRRAEQKRKGRMRGMGKTKGHKAGLAKEQWMARVRSQRMLLTGLRGKIATSERRRVYYMIKGGVFKSKAALMNYLKDNNLVQGSPAAEAAKPAAKKPAAAEIDEEES